VDIFRLNHFKAERFSEAGPFKGGEAYGAERSGPLIGWPEEHNRSSMNSSPRIVQPRISAAPSGIFTLSQVLQSRPTAGPAATMPCAARLPLVQNVLDTSAELLSGGNATSLHLDRHSTDAALPDLLMPVPGCSHRPPIKGRCARLRYASPPLTGARPPGNRSAYEMFSLENVHSLFLPNRT